jgi:hypothetical protein
MPWLGLAVCLINIKAHLVLQFIRCTFYAYFISFFTRNRIKIFCFIYSFHNFILRRNKNRFVPFLFFVVYNDSTRAMFLNINLQNKWKDSICGMYNPTVLLMVRSIRLKTGDDNLFRFSVVYVAQKIDIYVWYDLFWDFQTRKVYNLFFCNFKKHVWFIMSSNIQSCYTF